MSIRSPPSTWGGQYFSFSRCTAQGGDIYWMRASEIDRLRARP